MWLTSHGLRFTSPAQPNPFFPIASSLNRWRTSSPEYSSHAIACEGQARQARQVNENKSLKNNKISFSAQLISHTRYVSIYALPPSLRFVCHIFALLRSRCSQTAKQATKEAMSENLFLPDYRWDEWNTTKIQGMKLISFLTLKSFNKG